MIDPVRNSPPQPFGRASLVRGDHSKNNGNAKKRETSNGASAGAISNGVEAVNRTRMRLPNVPLEKIFTEVFKKKKIEISVAFIGDTTMKKFNRTYRGKDITTNVLAFPLNEHIGEIVISPRYAKREAQELGVSWQERLIMLLIHGMLHLQGYDHEKAADTMSMQRREQAIFKKINF